MKDTQVKLVTVTREDFPKKGYIVPQTTHSVTKFAHEFPEKFKDWYENSQYVVCLSVPNENHLKKLYEKLKWRDADVVAFTEPDIGNQLTAICYYGTPELRKITNKLKLALS